MREDLRAKADRLLTSGRVFVHAVDRSGVRATVLGDTGVRSVTFDGRWRCDCPALTVCSHATAVATVAVVPGPKILAPDALVGARR